jgi:hypothetical protein
MKYRIKLKRAVWTQKFVEVEADNVMAAMDKAEACVLTDADINEEFVSDSGFMPTWADVVTD